MPYYWKRGLLVGLVVGVMLHFLLQQLQARSPEVPRGNYQMSVPSPSQAPSRPRTSLGLVMGLTVFLLCCAMPGPNASKVGQ